MSVLDSAHAPRSLAEFWGLFPSSGLGPPPAFRTVGADQLPPSTRDLLVRSRHMTLALKERHGSELTLRVLGSRREGTLYARKSLLIAARTGAPVLLGFVHVDLAAFTPAVKEAILAEAEPLGGILIREEVPRRIEPYFFLEVDPTEKLRSILGVTGPGPVHGRSAAIHCEGGAVIDVLELVPSRLEENPTPR